MPKMAFRRTGQADIWQIEFPITGNAYVYSSFNPAETTNIEWDDGTIDPAGGRLYLHGSAIDAGLDLSLGKVYAVTYIKGQAGAFCVDVNADIETVLGGATWGVECWLDLYGAKNWQQF